MVLLVPGLSNANPKLYLPLDVVNSKSGGTTLYCPSARWTRAFRWVGNDAIQFSKVLVVEHVKAIGLGSEYRIVFRSQQNHVTTGEFRRSVGSCYRSCWRSGAFSCKRRSRFCTIKDNLPYATFFVVYMVNLREFSP